MTSRPHNLLLQDQKRDVRMRYWLRVGVVAMSAGTVAVLLAASSLMPALMLARSTQSEIEGQLAEYAVDAEDAVAVQKELESLRELARNLEAYGSGERVVDAFQIVLAVRTPDVRITTLAYEPMERVVRVEGVASNRSALASFEESLKKSAGVSSVSRPLSAYIAGDNGYSFSFTVALTERDTQETP